MCRQIYRALVLENMISTAGEFHLTDTTALNISTQCPSATFYMIEVLN